MLWSPGDAAVTEMSRRTLFNDWDELDEPPSRGGGRQPAVPPTSGSQLLSFGGLLSALVIAAVIAMGTVTVLGG